MCAAALAEARRQGFAAELAERLAAGPPGTCLIAGGEGTVTLSGPATEARESLPATGGPSQEAALAAAHALGTAADAFDATATSASAPGAPGSAPSASDPAADRRPVGPLGPPDRGQHVATCALFIDSDGTDGPTDAAGGLVDDLSASAARERGVDLGAALAAHDAYAALTRLGDLVFTGPTGTNVNDLRILLKGRRPA